MKWPLFGTSPKISKIFALLGILGLFKLVLLSGLALSLMDDPVNIFSPGALSQALAATSQKSTAPAATPAATQATSTPAAKTPAAAAAPGTPAQGISDERLALQRKEEELNRRERDLKQFEEELNGRLAKLKTLEASLKKMFDDAQALKDDKIKHLISVYTNMKAQQAAQVLSTLDESIAVKILAGMQGRQAGEIVTYMDPKKAAALTEALTRFQVPQ